MRDWGLVGRECSSLLTPRAATFLPQGLSPPKIAGLVPRGKDQGWHDIEAYTRISRGAFYLKK